MDTPVEKSDQKRPADFNSIGGCCLSMFLLLFTSLLTTVAASVLTGVWMRFTYAGAEFYPSSESRGSFHIFLYAFVLSAIPCAASALTFFIRSGTYSYIPWRRATGFFLRAYALIWLIATLITFFITVFFELPRWQVIRGG